jgi:hypothetical protein
MSELRECPFCGSEMLRETSVTGKVYYYHPDTGCLMDSHEIWPWSSDKAISEWNHRPTESALREEIRELTMMSPSEICGKYHIQNCHVCENDACCDNTNPAISALRKRVGELEGVIQPLMDELHELYGQHGYGGESLPMINARLPIAPQEPTPPETEART